MKKNKKSVYERLSEKSERLSEEAERLKKRSQLAYKLATNLQETESYSHEHLRNMFNNERIDPKIGGRFYYCAHGGEEKWKVINAFANNGDPLCIKIRDYYNDRNQEIRDSYEKRGIRGMRIDFVHSALGDSEVPEKLLIRTMTKDEYFGILNGDLPFTIDPHLKESYFLPKSGEQPK